MIQDHLKNHLSRLPLGLILFQSALAIGAAFTPAVRNAGYRGMFILAFAMSLLLPLAWMSRSWGRDAPRPDTWHRAAVYFALALLPPVAVVAAARFTTKGCEIPDGLAMLALGLLPGAFLAFSLTEVCESWAGRGRSALYVSLWILLLAQGILWFATEPVYQVAHPLIGMMLGPPNENPDVLTAPVAWFASEVTCWSLAMLSLARIGELRSASRWFHVVGLLTFATLAGLLVVQDAELGYRIDARYLDRELRAGGEVNGVKHVMAPTIPTDARPWLMVDAEFELSRQQALLKLPDERMPHTTIYWYRDRKQKKRFTGAEQTKFAKVHLGQLYLSADDFPARTLAHELSHVTSGALSDNLIKVPGRLGGLWYNPALVEGFAVAVAWSDLPLSAHEQARVAIEKNRAPALEELFSPLGFATTNLSVAYRLSGSFVRFCLDTYGPEPVMKWYATEDFQGAFGTPLAVVEAKWRDFLMADDKAALFSRDEDFIDKMQSRPSISQESCGRPDDDDDLNAALAAEADDEVYRILDARAAQDGEQAAVWFARAHYKAERANFNCPLPDTAEIDLGEKFAPRYDHLRALAAWGRGDTAQARQIFDALPASHKRNDNVILGRNLLRDGFPVDEFIADAPTDPTLALAGSFARTRHPAFGHKLAQTLTRAQRWDSAADVLSKIYWNNTTFPDNERGMILLDEAEMRGRTAFARRDWAAARAAWKDYLRLAPSEGRRAHGQTWIERTDFFEAHAERLTADLPRL